MTATTNALKLSPRTTTKRRTKKPSRLTSKVESEDVDNGASTDSTEEALCEMLGITSLPNEPVVDAQEDSDVLDSSGGNESNPEDYLDSEDEDDLENKRDRGKSRSRRRLERHRRLRSKRKTKRNEKKSDNLDNHQDKTKEVLDKEDAACNSNVNIPRLFHRKQKRISAILKQHNAHEIYAKDSVFVFPSELSIPPSLLRRWTDELTWARDKYPSDKTHETIKVYVPNKKKKDGQVAGATSAGGRMEERRVLTRMEHFVHGHPGWDFLCRSYVQECASFLCCPDYENDKEENLNDSDTARDQPMEVKPANTKRITSTKHKPGGGGGGGGMSLYKEKLNIKPAGGQGYAPHLDAPSLSLAFASTPDYCPKTFVTIMIAIDDMTLQNGCLCVVKGDWSEEKHVKVEKVRAPPAPSGNAKTDAANQKMSNPDGDGRAGAIPESVSSQLNYEPIPCKGGTIVAFNGWVPHRSAVNGSHFSRRAVFLTYNLQEEGDFREEYYKRMREWRDAFRREQQAKRGGKGKDEEDDVDWKNDLAGLDTIPRI